MANTYSLSAYGEMLRDKVRVDAYVEALGRLIGPESVVLELGTGTGFLACVAARLGAARVYAMEPSPFVEIAREIARKNGLGERITFLNEVSTRLQLPERVDIIVGDLRGALPISEDNIPSFQDAVARFLKPGGHVVPLEDTLLAALVQSSELYEAYSQPWTAGLRGFDLSAGLRCSTNVWGTAGRKKLKIVSKPSYELGRIRYDDLKGLGFSGSARLKCSHSGLVHGVMVWFRSLLTEGVTYSSGPSLASSATVYGRAFFPFTRSLTLTRGDELSFRLEARWTGQNYLWRWQTGAGGQPRFDQTNAFAEPLPFQAPVLAPERVLRLSQKGQLALLILQAAAEGRTAEEVAKLLVESSQTEISTYPEAHQLIGRHLEFFVDIPSRALSASRR